VSDKMKVLRKTTRHHDIPVGNKSWAGLLQ